MGTDGRVVFLMKGTKYLGRFSEGVAPFSPDGLRYGYVDTSGKVVIPPRFSVAGEFRGGMAVVKERGYGVIGRDGRYRISPKYLHVERAGYGLFWVRTEGGWVLADTSGRTLTDTPVQETYPFGEGGWAKVKADRGWGVMDTSGRWLVEPKYGYVEGYAEGVFLVRDSTGWGYIGSGKVLYWRKVPELPSAESLGVAPEVKIELEPPKLK